MTNVLWFSRHQPTEAQLAEISARGWKLYKLDDGLRLGGMSIQDDGDVHAVGYALLALAEESEAVAILGVWTAPMQELLARTAQDAVERGEWDGVPCYAAWNTSRPSEGGKPVFEHRRFCCVGRLAHHALRWSQAQ